MTDVYVAAPLGLPGLRNVLGLRGNTRDASYPGVRAVAGGRAGLPLCRSDGDGRLPGVVGAFDAGNVRVLRHVAAAIGWEVTEAPAEVAVPGGVQTVALAVLPPGGTAVADWDADGFARRWVPIWAGAIEEIAAYGDRFTPGEVAARLPSILSRAHSAVMALNDDRPFRGRFDTRNVTVHARPRPYSAFFAVDELQVSHARYDGRPGAPIERAVFMAADAVTVLPYDPLRDRVLLVEQFRAGPFARGDRRPWLLEPVAGRIEPGDTPEETAHKECREEAGLELSALHPVAEYYPSTGCFSEYIHSYVGIADLPDGAGGLHGVAEEQEDIRALVMPRAEFLARMQSGEMPDAPLILTAYWLMHNLERLRGVG